MQHKSNRNCNLDLTDEAEQNIFSCVLLLLLPPPLPHYTNSPQCCITTVYITLFSCLCAWCKRKSFRLLNDCQASLIKTEPEAAQLYHSELPLLSSHFLIITRPEVWDVCRIKIKSVVHHIINQATADFTCCRCAEQVCFKVF